MKKTDKKTITIRAFEARCARHALSHDGEVMKKCRLDSRWYNELGDYYFVDVKRNGITSKGIDLDGLVDWARKNGVLRPYEVVEGSAK